MFESILLALDGSPRDQHALDVARAVAVRSGSRLDLVHVTSGPGRREAKAYLDEVADGLDVVVGARHVLEHGAVDDLLVAEQLAHPRSLLCMATTARSGAGELLFGGHAAAVLRHVERPVLLVGPAAAVPTDLGTVLACVDGSGASTRSLLGARRWVEAMNGRLWLTRVVRSLGGDRRAPAAELEALAEATSRETGLFVERELLHGVDVAGAIARLARRLPASVLAVATRGATGPRDRLLGSTALRIVQHAPVPVLVLRAR